MMQQKIVAKYEQKKRTRYKQYLRQTNISISGANSNYSRSYLIELIILANLNKSIIDHIIYFFQHIHESQTKPQFFNEKTPYNQIFIFAIKLYFINDKYISLECKKTLQEQVALNNIIGLTKIDYMRDVVLRNQMKKLHQILSKEVQNQWQEEQRQIKINKGKSMEKKLNNFENYQLVRKLTKNWKNKLKDKILQLTNLGIRRVYIPENMEVCSQIYLQNILKIIIQMRYTNTYYRKQSFQYFLNKSYKTYYNINQITQAHFQLKRQAIRSRFSIKRYTQNSQQYLINLKDLVTTKNKQLPKKEGKQQSFLIIHSLCQELERHRNQTNKNYPFLHPKMIIFNQLSLKIQLSYENPLLESLGLLERPNTIQNKLCFRASPHPFDSFAYNDQLENPDLFVNYICGIQKILKNNDGQIQINKSFESQKILAGRKSQAWRFLMISSYLMNDIQYHKKYDSSQKSQLQYKQLQKQQLKKLHDPKHQNHVFDILGQNFMQIYGKHPKPLQFELDISFFSKIFQQIIQQDSVIATYSSNKLQNFIIIQNSLCSKYLQLIQKAPQCFMKLPNCIIYLFRFFIASYVQYSEIDIIADYFLTSPLRCIKQLKKIKNRLVTQDWIKTISFNYIEKCLPKFQVYKQRYSENIDMEHLKILFITYEKLNKKIPQVNQNFIQLYKTMKKLIDRSENSEVAQNNFTNMGETITNIKKNTSMFKAKLKRNISSLIKKQINSRNRASNDPQKQYHIKRNEAIALSIFNLTTQNIALFQSIVFPSLNLQSKKKDVIIDNKTPPPQKLPNQIQMLKYAIEIIRQHDVKVQPENESVIIQMMPHSQIIEKL